MSPINLTAQLQQYTGTSAYYRLYPKVVLTDGAKFLAEEANCFWLMDVYASHLLCTIDGEQESFTCLQMLTKNHHATIVIDDGNGVELAKQTIDFTDFPLHHIKLYACWENTHWVIMLTSEY
jgi:hypothetical protein